VKTRCIVIEKSHLSGECFVLRFFKIKSSHYVYKNTSMEVVACTTPTPSAPLLAVEEDDSASMNLGSETKLSPTGSFDDSSLRCCITDEIMVDPVSTPGGHSYERHALTKWMTDGTPCSPLTRQALKPSDERTL